MVFEFLKGKTLGWIPEEHGFSQREVKDTIRRIEALMEDLGKLLIRKEKELEKKKSSILSKVLTANDFIGGVDYYKKRNRELADVATQLALDKAMLEFELPFVEKALEHVPEETPPMRHEDYYKRLRKIEGRRGEYWRLNPTFMGYDDRRAGIGRRTPEEVKYYPTHQVPWEQGAPSPPPYVSPPLPPPPPPESPTRNEWTESSSSDEWEYPNPHRYDYDVRHTSSFRSAKSSSSESCGDIFEGVIAPTITPYPEDPIAEQALKALSEVADEVDAINFQLMKIKTLAHGPVESPTVGEEQQHEAQQPTPPGQQPVYDVSHEAQQPTPPGQQPVYDHEAQQPTPPGQQPVYDVSHGVQQPTPPGQLPVYDHEAQQSTPPGQQPVYDDDSPGIICPERIHSEAFSPEVLGVDEMEILMDNAFPESPGIICPERIASEAFSPQVLDVDELEIMMDDAIQRITEAELLDPDVLQSGAFSPQVLDDETIQLMLEGLRGAALLISPGALEGLNLMQGEPLTPELSPGALREKQWNERVARWREQERREQGEEKRREEERLTQGRQMDARALFGIHQRSISAPPRSPTTDPPHCQPPSYKPEVLPWFQSPSDRITPPPVKEKKGKGKGKGKRLIRPEPVSPGVVCEVSPSGLNRMPPSWLLFPETKGGPTVYRPDLPTTSETIFNTRRREFVHLNKWKTPPDAELKLTYSRIIYENRLKPGPPILPPKPATPPPPPPPEYGPEPEHLSVYIPETVYESPETLKERIYDAIDRFEIKMREVQQRLEPRMTYWSGWSKESPWVREDYIEQPTSTQRLQEAEARDESESKAKWEAFMLCKYGVAVPRLGKYGRIRLPRTASTLRYREPSPPPPRKKAPVNKPYEEPLYGPWLPWVAGSNRPPPKTAAGRICSPYTPPPRPVVRRPEETPPGPCPPPRERTPRTQPEQVQYGSTRPPPKTAASYKYSETPLARPATTRGSMRCRRLVPSTPEVLYGTTRAPPRTAASSRPQTPGPTPRRRQDATPQRRLSPDRGPDPTRSAPLSMPDISLDALEGKIFETNELIERAIASLSPVVDSFSPQYPQYRRPRC